MADYVYKIMTQDEQDDIQVEFLASQERDLFCHMTSLTRYDAMLAELPTGAFKTRIQQLRADTQSRILEVSSIIAAHEAQMPTAERITASSARISEKNALLKG